MNRDMRSGRFNDSESFKQNASTINNSNYLVILFLLSAIVIVALPYLLPAGNMLARSGKKGDVEEKVSTESYTPSPINKMPSYAPTVYPSLSSSALTSSDYMVKRVYNSESKCEALEFMVMDLQKVVHIEREKTLHLENEIRILQISENFLKDRVQYLEDKAWESRKDTGSGYASSLEYLMQNNHASDSKRGSGNGDAVVQDLMKMVQTEKERTTALEMEVRLLQKSESLLIDKIENLEAQFAAMCKQTNACDSSNKNLYL